jgi:hypothetical protein
VSLNKPRNQTAVIRVSWFIGNVVDLYSGGPLSSLDAVLISLLRLFMIILSLSKGMPIKYLEFVCEHFSRNPNLFHYHPPI